MARIQLAVVGAAWLFVLTSFVGGRLQRRRADRAATALQVLASLPHQRSTVTLQAHESAQVPATSQ